MKQVTFSKQEIQYTKKQAQRLIDLYNGKLYFSKVTGRMEYKNNK